MHRILILIGLVGMVVLVFVGCASAPPASHRTPAEAAPPPPAPRSSIERPPPPQAPLEAVRPPMPAPLAPRPGPLEAERRWLADLFEGTPVRVIAEAGGGVRVEVPLVHAFDADSSQPKRPLHGVLERVGQSLKRQPSARLAVAAPGPIGPQRQRAMREQLMAMGLAPHRVSAAGSATAASGDISLRLAAAPAAIHRLRDRDLPPPPAPRPAAAFRPPAIQ